MAHKNKTNYSPYKARRQAAAQERGPSSTGSGENIDRNSVRSKQSEKKDASFVVGGSSNSSRAKGSSSAASFSAENASTKGSSSVNSSNFAASSSAEDASTKGYSLAQNLRGKHKQAIRVFTFEEANDRLYDLFRNHEFGDYPHAKRKQLAHFYTLLMEIQKKENFTRLTELRDIGIKHFIDCLMVTRLTKLKFPLMDVGTGPGFPGIPLKIEFPEETIILAEGVQRRVEFLKDVRDKMELQALPILGRNINPECFYPVQGVITRAVEDLRNTLGNVIHCLQLGGRVYFMKGPGVDPEIPMAQEAWGEYYKLVEDHRYVLPKTEQERRLIVFEKIKSPVVSDEFLESLGLTDEHEDTN